MAVAGDVQHIRGKPHGTRVGSQPDRRRDAGGEGVQISFWEYCKVGIPLTVLTLIFGIAWLEFVHY